jgi:glycerate 2-kinase
MKNLKKEASSIMLSVLKEVDLQSLIKEKVEVCEGILRFDNEVISLIDFDEILLIGFGKASLEMGFVLESLLASKIKRGILVTNRHNNKSLMSEVIVAGHPTPDEHSLLAAKKILSALESSTEKTLVIFLISGGGSSLVELPVQGITLEELQQLNKTLVGCGATIQEINIIRKRLSQIKGGKLGIRAKKMKCLAIYLSDVNEGDLSSLASGPLFMDDTAIEQFNTIIEKYSLLEKMPPAIAAILQKEVLHTSEKAETQKQTSIAHMLLLDNADLLKMAATVAEDRGLKVEICREWVEGEYQKIAEELLQRLIFLQEKFPQETVCLLSGGEVACSVRGEGIGGRNQEFVLYCATRFSELSNNLEVVVLSCGTDGIDGVSCAAGAVISSVDFYKSNRLEYHASFYIEQNNSHSFLKQSGGLLVLGPTGNNVRDLRILLARPKTITKESQND